MSSSSGWLDRFCFFCATDTLAAYRLVLAFMLAALPLASWRPVYGEKSFYSVKVGRFPRSFLFRPLDGVLSASILWTYSISI